MEDKNLNDFFDEELKKQEEKTTRQQTNYVPKPTPYGFDGDNQQKHEQMYRVVPGYYANGQQNYIQKPSRSKKGFIAALVALGMIIVYFLGYFSFMFLNPDIKFINDVLGLINTYAYVMDESEDKYAHDYAYIAANAMLQSIDQYSRLLTPEEYYELMYPQDLSTESNGIGYSLNDEGDYYIAEVEVGSPAYQKGLFMGDVVLNLNITGNHDGVAAGSYPVSKDLPTEQFVKYIHSQEIDFTIKRDGVVMTINDVVQSGYVGTAVEYYFGDSNTNMSDMYRQRLTSAGSLPADVGYIRLTSFMDPYTIDGEQGQGDFAKAMALFKQTGKKKLIFDLTYNTGGRNDISEGVASFLVFDKNKPDGKDVLISTDRDKDDNVISQSVVDSVYGDYFNPYSSQAQIVVLTNELSASASELMVGALLDYGTAVQVGTKTYGKGIGQGVIQLKSAQANVGGQVVDSYWAAYMTIIKFYTPVSDVCKHGVGFTPSAENIAQDFDDQVARAIQLLS
ncbi:MAG: hypothetical protein IJV77_00755 [Clostridia bacterium]|nr:hypothetical protein [Clostridia bacterium]